MGVDVVLGYHLVCPFKNLGMTWSCAGSDYLRLGCEPWWGLWVSRPWTWESPQFTLNRSFILMSLHLVNKSNPVGFKRFHVNLLCHGMCK
jgi:hypothetical protein